MKIAVMAGAGCDKIGTVLRKYSLDLRLYPDLTEGLNQVTMSVNVDQMLLMDEALVKEGKLLDLEQVFIALDEMRPVNDDMEILFVTRSETAYDMFNEVMVTNPRARCELVTRLNSNILFECVNGSFKEIVQEVVTEEATKIVSVVEEMKEEPIVEPKPPEPKPVKKKEVVVPKEKKKKREVVVKKREKLGDLITMNQIVVVTGNPNSGVTSTFCGMADVLQEEKIDTIMVDMDIYSKGVTMYYPHLNGGCDPVAKNGLKNALQDLDNVEDNIYRVKPDLAYIGTTSYTSHKFLMEVLDMRHEVCDLTQMLAEEFRVTLVHIPLEMLLDNPTLIRDCNSVVYCTEGTINGIYNIDKFLNKQHLTDRDQYAAHRVLHRKLNYILTNYIPNTIKSNQWLRYLLDTTEENSLHRYVLGTIPHIQGFDDFVDNKELITKDREQRDNIHSILTNLFKI